jgi:hypothetical protein
MVKNKINMINVCLLAIGETPIPETVDPNSLEAGTDAAIARNIVEQTMREILSQGWWFNVDYKYPFVPDANKTINVPNDLLRVDFTGTGYEGDIVFRKGMFYSLKNKSFFFDKPLKGTAIWLVEPGDLPDSAYNYISLRAAKRFQTYVLGSDSLYKFNEIDEQEAYQRLYADEVRFRKRNLMQGSRIINRTANPTPIGG